MSIFIKYDPVRRGPTFRSLSPFRFFFFPSLAFFPAADVHFPSHISTSLLLGLCSACELTGQRWEKEIEENKDAASSCGVLGKVVPRGAGVGSRRRVAYVKEILRPDQFHIVKRASCKQTAANENHQNSRDSERRPHGSSPQWRPPCPPSAAAVPSPTSTVLRRGLCNASPPPVAQGGGVGEAHAATHPGCRSIAAAPRPRCV